MAWPVPARAQQPAKSYRIALIHPFARVEALREGTKGLEHRVVVNGTLGYPFFFEEFRRLGYGSGPPEAYRRVANAVAEILRGAKPSEIPFYQASRFELVVNLKTAKALDLTLPPLIMAGVDELVE